MLERNFAEAETTLLAELSGKDQSEYFDKRLTLAQHSLRTQ